MTSAAVVTRAPAGQAAPRDGRYDLRITAELWETHFFDLVSLLVVDHPEGTEVFVDERFAVPAPRLDVIVTSPVQPFAHVRDDQGRDAADIVRERDDRHLDFAGRGRYQGVTREHHIEIELPESAPRGGSLWLVARGWVHPTDSSINVALGQGSHPPPAGLSLHVADRTGRFKRARTGLGFPAGKDKTILIDLDEQSRILYQQFGAENSKLLFLQLKPGEHPNYPDGKEDNTHFNELGARLIAQLVLKEIKEKIPGLNSKIIMPVKK